MDLLRARPYSAARSIAATFGRRDFTGRWRTADEVHAMSLANLDGEYAKVITTDELLARA